MTHAPAARVIRTVIVDDEPLARLRLRTLLAEHADFSVVAECADGREALEVIARERPELVFLDVQMSEMDGVAVARALDAATAPTIVFVTAFDQYAVRAFEVHALDYLLKPFDEERFVATLERVRLRRTGTDVQAAHGRLLALLRDLSRGDLTTLSEVAPARAAAFRVGSIEVDVRARMVRKNGAPVSLRPKEFDLLVALLKRAGDVVSRRELLQEVWGYSDDVVSRTIDTHVAELRRKLGHAPGEPGYIATVSRSGYRLHI